MLWHSCYVGRKCIRFVKTECCYAVVVIWLDEWFWGWQTVCLKSHSFHCHFHCLLLSSCKIQKSLTVWYQLTQAFLECWPSNYNHCCQNLHCRVICFRFTVFTVSLYKNSETQDHPRSPQVLTQGLKFTKRSVSEAHYSFSAKYMLMLLDVKHKNQFTTKTVYHANEILFTYTTVVLMQKAPK